MPLTDCYCDAVLNYTDLRAYHDLTYSPLADHQCHQTQQQGCYIGALPWLTVMPLVPLSFTGKKPRSSFSREERDLLRLMSRGR